MNRITIISGVSTLATKCQQKTFFLNRRSSDITNFTCILILYGLSRENLLELKKCVLDISWKSSGNWLGWICRHPNIERICSIVVCYKSRWIFGIIIYLISVMQCMLRQVRFASQLQIHIIVFNTPAWLVFTAMSCGHSATVFTADCKHTAGFSERSWTSVVIHHCHLVHTAVETHMPCGSHSVIWHPT